MALGFVAFSRFCITNSDTKISSKYYIYILSRCLSLCAPELSKAVTMRRRNVLLVVLIWVYAVLLVLPSLLQLYGSFGYNRRLGKVDCRSSNHQQLRLDRYKIGTIVHKANHCRH